MKKKLLKHGLKILCSMMLVALCVVLLAPSASAAGIPAVYLDTNTNANFYTGQNIDLVFLYYPGNRYEELWCSIYDSSGEEVAFCDESFDNYNTSSWEYTISWDTTDYAPGTYKIVMEKWYCDGNDWYAASDGVWFITLKPGRTGWERVNGSWVYYKNGTLQTNSWVKDSTGWCYVDGSGYMVYNKWVKDSTGWCYVGTKGYMVYNQWVKDSTGWCYVDGSGYMVYNKWVRDSKGWCYVGGNGYMLTNGWAKDSVGWCYLGADGYMVKNCWKKDSKGWCYLKADGHMATNEWIADSKGWCYVESTGYCATNCFKRDSVGWVWLDSVGSMVKNQWIALGDDWYYINNNGYRVTGSVMIDGESYTFDSDGVLMQDY